EKGQEPESFTKWKAQANEDWQPRFEDLRSQEKRDVYAALLQEQGYLCCYCMIRITNSNNSAQAGNEDSDPCHIEHLKPQEKFPQLDLDYNNLLASCKAEQSKTNPPPPSRCGYKKDNWYDEKLLVSPLQPDCESFFRYSITGEIMPVADPEKHTAAQATIERLGLNLDRLRDKRKRVMDDILDIIDTLTDEEIDQLIQGLKKRNAQGQYEPFSTAVVFVLQSSYTNSKK
ncbi:MAG: TIGR02646 family protein, partial [Symploca sp. SIO1B1]|nr:TIGR02646 family protein [Symploca sp. SIO1B1]